MSRPRRRLPLLIQIKANASDDGSISLTAHGGVAMQKEVHIKTSLGIAAG